MVRELRLHPRAVDREVQRVLLDILRADKDDNIRLMAAKILLSQTEKFKSKRSKNAIICKDEENQNEKEEFASTVAEARSLMAEFASAKLDCLGEQGAMDKNGTAATDHSKR